MEKLRVEIHGYGSAHFSKLVGRILAFTDTLGLDEQQRKAYKALVKDEIWSLWDNPSFLEDKEVEFPTAILEDSFNRDKTTGTVN